MANLGNFREAAEVVLPYSTKFCSNDDLWVYSFIFQRTM